tara:strand:+ start:754 stop:1155 length:402 start_codon:yes stop_codon:yes gene_type:complete
MKHIENNIVEEFLKKHPQKNLSLIKIKRELKIPKNDAFFFAMNSKNVRKVKPYEVGSGRHKISVFTYNDIPDDEEKDDNEMNEEMNEEKETNEEMNEEKNDKEMNEEKETNEEINEEEINEEMNEDDNIIDLI